MKKTYVLDTNVLLYSAQSLESFEDNEVIIPMAVIEELDRFKKNQDELGRNARQVIRKLDELRENGRLAEGVALQNSPDPNKCGSLRVVTSQGSLPANIDMSLADNRILNVARMMREEHKSDPHYQVIFITKDINLRLKADALGIFVEDFEREKVNFDELYNGFRELLVPSATVDSFYQDKNIPVPEGLEIYPNEFVLLRDDTNNKHSGLAWCRNARLESIPDGVCDKVWNITPRSKEQRMALQLLMDPSIQVVTLVGQAGSGKTLLALAAALENVLQGSDYEKILVSRPIIPLGNDIGYLPGTKDEKLEVWMQPIYDNLDYLMHSEKRGDAHSVRRQIDELKRNHKLELEALTYIRGRSIPRQFVIIDEAQNLTPHEVKTIVSRAGEGTKMILTGDPYQIDSPYLDASSNGLSYIVERFKRLPMHGHVTLHKSERSPLAAAAAEYL